MSGPVCLVILDGYGVGEGGGGDATALAETPFFDRIDQLYPRSELETSGAAVGLPDGQMGNSEVGHMTLGAGRILDQDMVRIQKAFDSGAFHDQDAVRETIEAAKAGHGRVHLLGLVSNGGVHSSLDHLEGIIDCLEAAGVRPILHAFTDGRDTPPQSALTWIRPLEARLRAAGGCIATVSGRYYAMDRDKRWERVARAVKALVAREGEAVTTAVEAVEKAYGREQGDEFIEPSIVGDSPGIEAGDVVLFFNFRADRARELTNALTRTQPDQLGAEVKSLDVPMLRRFATLTMYDETFNLPVIFDPLKIDRSFGELVSEAGYTQLRIAETEKYAHVTYFFNGGREQPFEGEDRILVPSPRDVPTYDHKPEMSAVEVTDKLIEALESNDYRFVLLNFANPDMLGHTGVIPACVRAVEVIDACLDRITVEVLRRGGTMLITADHGNIERLIDDENGGPHTAHTTNPVPVYWILANAEGSEIRRGGLADVAPTLCKLLDFEQPSEMTGRSLVTCGSGWSTS